MKKLLMSLMMLLSIAIIGQENSKFTNRLSGAEWATIYTNPNGQIQKLFFVNANVGYAVGFNGTILKTADAGDNWSTQNSGVSVSLNDVYFVNETIGYAVGSKGDTETVLKTTDGGTNWVRLTLDNANDRRDFYGVCFTDADNGYVVGKWGTIVKTTDGGTNWTRRTGSDHLLDITFVNSTTGFAVGNNTTILKTTDSGANWVEKNSGSTGIAEVFFSDESNGFVAGLANTLLKTTDGGENWATMVSDRFANDTYLSVSFTDNNTGYTSMWGEDGNPYFLKTVDGGANWNSTVLSAGMKSIVFPTNNTGFSASGANILKYSTGPTPGGAIVSTTSGGWWHETSTWIGGVLPTATDDVVINGTVRVKNTWPSSILDECNNLTINSGDSLYGDELGNYAALVECNGNLLNNGTISQNGTYFDFIIDVDGDIINNGELAVKTIWFQSQSAQTITSANTIETLIIEMKNGQNLIAGSDLSFVNTFFQFNNGDFIIEDGRTVSFLSTEGGSGNGNGHVDKAHIKGGGTIFSGGSNSTSNVYWFNDSTTVENITLTGNIRGKADFAILGNVINKDTLQQAEHNYEVHIPFEEDFTNDGVIRDNPMDNDFLGTVIRKDAVNKGNWINSWMIMEGSADQSFTNEGVLTSNFEFRANVSSATTFQWYKDAVVIDGATSEYYKYYVPYNMDDYNPYGEYYCQTNAGNSRTISIVNGNSGNSGTILTENFDGSNFPPNGWTQTIQNTSNTWRKGNPSNNPFTDIDPTNVYSAICPWVAADQDEWLKSPVVALPNDAISLNFYCGYSTDYLSNATLKLNISTNGGANWTNIWEANNDGAAWQWREISLDLSNYKNNSNVMLGWQYVGNDGDLVGIDNVNLTYGTVGIEEDNEVIPTKYNLNQNYPNPFNPTTIISYSLPSQELVTINIYNILGQKVTELVNNVQLAGNYTVNFDAGKLSSGTYIYQIKAGNFVQSKKMLLLK